MKIKDIAKHAPLAEIFGETRPALYLEWLQLLGIISENGEAEATHQDHAAMIYFLTTAECKSDIENKLANSKGIPSEISFLAKRLAYIELSTFSIFDLLAINLSKGRIEFVYYPDNKNFIGKAHFGVITTFPGDYILKYWESLNL
ncbi:MAG: hypothetical protein LT105_15035 [Lentimicrobium sp.]|nr:hypothetical protein [Lentimicrobium sp.]